jgi:hypothetical protein
MSENKGVPVLPPGVKVPIEIGTGFVKELFDVMGFILSDKTPEQMKALEQAMQDGTHKNEPWMSTYVTVAMLVKHIEEVAIEKDLVTYSDLSTLDNPVVDQVQSQPE